MKREEKARRVQSILDEPLSRRRRPPRPSGPLHAADRGRAVGPMHGRARQPGGAETLCARLHTGRDAEAPRRRDSRDHPALRPGAAEIQGDRLAVARPGRETRRRGARYLRGVGSPARSGTQDGERGDGPGLRSSGLPGRHPHPPARPTLGALPRRERGAHRAQPEEALSPRELGPTAPADHLLSAANTVPRAATTSASASSAPGPPPGPRSPAAGSASLVVPARAKPGPPHSARLRLAARFAGLVVPARAKPGPPHSARLRLAARFAGLVVPARAKPGPPHSARLRLAARFAGLVVPARAKPGPPHSARLRLAARFAGLVVPARAKPRPTPLRSASPRCALRWPCGPGPGEARALGLPVHRVAPRRRSIRFRCAGGGRAGLPGPADP